MIISISGAGCTGKSTLFQALRDTIGEEFLNDPVVYISELIREIFERNYSCVYPTYEEVLRDPLCTIDIHLAVARELNSILENYNKSSILILDRSPIDVQLYLSLNVKNNLRYYRNFVSAYFEISSYIEYFLSLNPYIFYALPFQEKVEYDGFRPISLMNRREEELKLFDNRFSQINSEYPSRYFELPSDLDSRLRKVMEIINNELLPQ